MNKDNQLNSFKHQKQLNDNINENIEQERVEKNKKE